MSSPDGKSFLAANFGTVEAWSQGKVARAHLPRDPALRKKPGDWFKKDRVEMRIDYRPRPRKTGDPEKGEVSIGYDTTDVLRGETPINVAAVPARKGLVGFSWSGTKFNVRMLKITGKLDRPAAVKLLREKLNRGNSEPGIAGRPPECPREDPPEPAPGGNLAWVRRKV